LRKARRRIEQAPRVAERDFEDAIYLACAVDGGASLITTEDSDLRALGDEYEVVLILSWGEFLAYVRQHRLLPVR
jgi:predicted nucleic acid-binding protein